MKTSAAAVMVEHKKGGQGEHNIPVDTWIAFAPGKDKEERWKSVTAIPLAQTSTTTAENDVWKKPLLSKQSYGRGEEFEKMTVGQEANGQKVCTSRECARMAALFASNLNEKADPCDDFYEFACGNYPLSRELPASRPIRHTIIDAQTILHKQVKQVLEETPTTGEKPWDRFARDYYRQCLDENKSEAIGKEALISLLETVGALLIELTITHDPKNSSVTIIELDQPKWGIGSRWPYLSGMNDSMVRNYTQLIIETAIKMGANPATAYMEMREVVELEIKLVKQSADETVRRDPVRSNNPFQIHQLKEAFPLIDFEAYLKRTFEDIVDIQPNDTVIIREVDFFKKVQKLLNSTSKRTLANYVGWRIVQGFSPFLPPSFRIPFYDFKANQTAMFNVPMPERWEDCISLSILLLDMPVGKLFVENFFNEKFAVDKVTEMTAYLRNAFTKQLSQLHWMDATTRKRAILKANRIEYKSGYPPQLFNDTWMAANWGFKQNGEDESLLHLTVRIKLARTVDELARFKRPVDRSLWYQSPAQVDAFYAPNLNEMIFPAGIMQYPFLATVPNYVVYAAVGAVISHELTHSIDDQGGRYDELGNLNDWWDGNTAKTFYKKAECFVQQYQQERLREIGVVVTALNAYASWLNDSKEEEPKLPGFQNYTSQQMFFLAYANNWCSMIHPRYVNQLIQADVHAPARLRAVIPLRNRGEFAEAFHCQMGAPMNPTQKCEIW
uniref:Endothelin-converting enzyme 1 n=1 Tax=Ditylenchus dipsaci TaxID=166011 RepID=A0A915CTB1_9BILA